jgi:hypothetical protein
MTTPLCSLQPQEQLSLKTQKKQRMQQLLLHSKTQQLLLR